MQHWVNYLDDLNDNLIWTANKYLTNPTTDGGKARVPTLESTNLDGTIQRAETNEDKSQMLAAMFFPPKLTMSQVPNDYKYPKGLHTASSSMKLSYGDRLTN